MSSPTGTARGARERTVPAWAVVTTAAALCGAVLTLPALHVAALCAGVVGIGVTLASPRLALLLWFVTTPVMSFWIRVSLPAGVPDLTYDRGFIVFIVGVLALRRLTGQAGPWHVGRVEAAMAAYAIVAAFGLLRGGNLTTDLQFLLDGYLTPFLMYAVTRRVAADRPDARPFLVATGAVALGLAALGTAQMALHRIPLLPAGFVPIHVGRMTGPFYNAAEFGGVVAAGVLALVMLGSLESRRPQRAAAALGAAVCAGATVASLTRAAWLALLLAGGLVAWRYRPSRRAFAATAAVALVVAALALPLLLAPGAIMERGAEEKPVQIRLVSAMTAGRMWVDRPLLGYGFGRWTYYRNRGEYYTGFGDISAERGAVVGVPHNEFLHQLVLTGAIGLACHLVVWLGALAAAAAGLRDRRRDVRALAAVLLGVVAIYLVNGLFADLIFFPFLTMAFCVLFGAVRGLLDVPRPEAAP